MAGMDPKILAAVFASVAALAVGSGGSGNIDNLQGLNPQDLVGDFMDSPSKLIQRFQENPEPENRIKAEIKIDGETSKIDFRNSELKIKNLTELSSSSRKITSDKDLTFKGFRGSVILEKDNKTEIKGRSNGFKSSGVTFSKDLDLNFRTDSKTLTARNISRSSFELKDVDIKMKSQEDSTSIQKDNSRLKINSFSGKATIYPENMTLILKGSVDKFNAGGTVFKG